MKMFNKPRNLFFHNGIKYRIINAYNAKFGDLYYFYEHDQNTYLEYGMPELYRLEKFKDKPIITVDFDEIFKFYDSDNPMPYEIKPGVCQRKYIGFNTPPQAMSDFALAYIGRGYGIFCNHNEIACDLFDQYFETNNMQFVLSDEVVKIKIDGNQFFIDTNLNDHANISIIHDAIKKYCTYANITESVLLFPDETKLTAFKSNMMFILRCMEFKVL